MQNAKCILSYKSFLSLTSGVTTRKRLNADVVFLMDASTADSSSYFQSQKDLIKSIIRSLGTAAVKLRASLLVYSSSTNVLADLRSYTTLERFEDVVDRATYVRGVCSFDLYIVGFLPFHNTGVGQR